MRYITEKYGNIGYEDRIFTWRSKVDSIYTGLYREDIEIQFLKGKEDFI
jgi:hypothetical protein